MTTWDPVAPTAQPPITDVLTVWTVPVGHSISTVSLYTQKADASALVSQLGDSIAIGSC